MYHDIRKRIDQTVNSVRSNSTAISCGATAGLTYYFTRKYHLKEAAHFGYYFGTLCGVDVTRIEILKEFIALKGLTAEFQDWAPSVFETMAKGGANG